MSLKTPIGAGGHSKTPKGSLILGITSRGASPTPLYQVPLKMHVETIHDAINLKYPKPHGKPEANANLKAPPCGKRYECPRGIDSVNTTIRCGADLPPVRENIIYLPKPCRDALLTECKRPKWVKVTRTLPISFLRVDCNRALSNFLPVGHQNVLSAKTIHPTRPPLG
ncbi:hypothetical protein BGW80DRAFT_683747 [Lactifluus volemus]|nr:hypothetical protein BGW80DRAFT_683747 [Lactifluus volemus]